MADSKEVYDFKKQIAELEKYRGRGTELISVYVTPGYPISDIAGKLRDEYGQASNIKSKSTQKNVQAAIEKILAFLKTVPKPPENGVAIFAGNVSEVEGRSDVRLFYVIPPSPLHVQFYRCESTFVTEPLKEMLEQTGSYGLVVMDGKEATIALLKGKDIKLLRKLTSTAHQKVHKGGQCIHESELVQFTDGRIAQIKEVREGDALVGVNLSTGASKSAAVTRVFRRSASRAIVLKVKNPVREITVTPEHRFFVIDASGLIEKTAEELVVGDRLLFAKEMAVESTSVEVPVTCAAVGVSSCQVLDVSLAQFLGYFLGDGSVEQNRVNLCDASRGVIESYTSLGGELLGARPCVRKRVDKGYFEGRVHSLERVSKLKEAFPTVFTHGLKRTIPVQIEKADSAVIAAFLRGLFDAEATVSSGKISIAMANEEVTSRLPFLLSRFGIISSFCHKKAQYKQQYSVDINDFGSLHRFKAFIGFSSPEKRSALNSLCEIKARVNCREQVPVDGRWIARKIKSVGMTHNAYAQESAMFLCGKRSMSFEVFRKRIVAATEKRLDEIMALEVQIAPLKKARRLLAVDLTRLSRLTGLSRSLLNHTENGNYWGADFSQQVKNALEQERVDLVQKTRAVLSEFNKISDSGCISAVLVRKREITPSESEQFIDLSLPEIQNFVVNNFCVHNSAARYQRIHEEVVEVYYKRIGEAMDSFTGVKGFKGVIVGGPGPAKEDFLRLKPFNYQQQVLGTVDTGYTDENGLREQ
ncbi:MAG: LAGLIDADG family homing endonuclease, partial [Candidatus Micrarchaeota archaeon]